VEDFSEGDGDASDSERQSPQGSVNPSLSVESDLVGFAAPGESQGVVSFFGWDGDGSCFGVASCFL
jgi:hypothetical protein